MGKLWNKKLEDITIGDYVVMSCIGLAIAAVPMTIIGVKDSIKLHQAKKQAEKEIAERTERAVK